MFLLRHIISIIIITLSVGNIRAINTSVCSTQAWLDSIVRYNSKGESVRKSAFSWINQKESVIQTDSIFIDSMGKWLPERRYTNRFDAAGNTLLWQTESFDPSSNGRWIGENRINYKYDINGQLIVMEIESWEPTQRSGLGGWMNGSRYYYYYDSKKRVIMIDGYLPSSNSNEWEPFDRTLYAYNGLGKIESTISLIWEFSRQHWVNRVKCEMRYNIYGNPSERIIYDWKQHNTADSERWEADYRCNISYDSTTGKQTETLYQWTQIGGGWQWIEYSLINIGQDVDRGERTFETYFWNNLNQEWQGEYSETNNYSPTGLLLSSEHRKWNIEKNEWESLTRRVSEYDAASRPQKEIVYTWCRDNSEWRIDYTETFWFGLQTHIEQPKAEDTMLRVISREDRVTILNAEVGASCTLFTLQGEQIWRGAIASDYFSIQIDRKGILILKIGNQSLKLIH